MNFSIFDILLITGSSFGNGGGRPGGGGGGNFRFITLIQNENLIGNFQPGGGRPKYGPPGLSAGQPQRRYHRSALVNKYRSLKFFRNRAFLKRSVKLSTLDDDDDTAPDIPAFQNIIKTGKISTTPASPPAVTKNVKIKSS